MHEIKEVKNNEVVKSRVAVSSLKEREEILHWLNENGAVVTSPKSALCYISFVI